MPEESQDTSQAIAAEVKEDPWDVLFSAQGSFLNDLETIGELVQLVIPLLAKHDNEREQRITDLTTAFRDEKPVESITFKSMEDIKEFLGHVRRMRRGDRVFRHGIITSIVARFDEYFSKVLRICFRLNPGWLKNTEKKMSYKELLEIKSLDDLKEEIISKEIDGLMRDSHHAQITFLDEKLKIGVEEHFSQWKEFLEITERRNLFVHTGGQVSSQYLNNCAKWQIQVNCKSLNLT